ncbi:MAG: DUF3710 domain-containing protein [Actinomycetes bacterium]
MSWFRRSRQDPDEDQEPSEGGLDEAAGSGGSDVAAAGGDEEQSDESAHDEDAAAETAGIDLRRSEQGPFDESEADDDVPRVDLGALRLAVREGMELRLELEEQTQRVMAATVSLAGSSVQLQAFAAPRTEGVWDDIRTEIAASVSRQGGSADDLLGSLGRELLARIPARMPDGRSGHQVVRFTGVDGPRWFLRAVFHGPAAVDDRAAKELEEVVRATVVVRGKEAMAPRDLLPLTLPATQPPAAAEGQAGDGEAGAGQAGDGQGGDEGDGEASRRRLPDPLQRGPEITEIG